ncbi:cathepsin D [Malassezia psittaci]|uniref:Cathepsin D n=1 Tax=Malassezia psittaci TaxID=1821823 RepID=A0AAF0JFZ1_9BASI|nr:cathepsin D [Malassezia psittaci]
MFSRPNVLILSWGLVWASLVCGQPTTSVVAETHESHGIQVSIMTNKQALHPRNGNLQGDALFEWMHRERNKLHRKYNKTDSSSNTQLEARQLVGIGNYGDDSFYFMPIGVGTPSKTLNVLMDTGSSDFWLVDKGCTESNGCSSSMTLFDAASSSTFQNSSRQFLTPYGDGSNTVSGNLGADVVSMSGYQVDNLTFGSVSQLIGSTIQAPASGLMGMGFESLSSSGSTPFWEVVALQGRVKDPIFSFQLTSASSSEDSKVIPGGIFSLGVLDDRQYTGDITWIDLTSGYGSNGIGYWAITMDRLQVNGDQISLGSSNIVAVDTGTTLLGGPSKVLEEIYSKIPGVESAPTSLLGGSGYYLYPCTQTFTLTLTFGGKDFKLDNDNLNLGRVSETSEMCVSSLFVASDSESSSMPSWILGDTFLRTVFSAYSWNPQRVGFASLPSSGVSTLPITSLTSGESFSESSTSAASEVSSSAAGQTTSKTINTSQTGLLGGSGLPTPSLVSEPSSFQSLASLSNYGLGSGGKSGSAPTISVVSPMMYIATLIAFILPLIL